MAYILYSLKDDFSLNLKFWEPAQPFEQLLGVFPKQSSHAIPKCYRHLLSDPLSEIIDFYPTHFKLDINGARYAWMGVNLLPFIDRQRLINAMKKCEKLTEYEKERNGLGSTFLFFVGEKDSKSAIQQTMANSDYKSEKLEIISSFKRMDGLGGKIRGFKNAQNQGSKIQPPFGNMNLEVIEENHTIQVKYEHPQYEKHLSKMLEGVRVPRREVEDHEIYHIDRRYFNGERAVQMASRIIGIDNSVSAIYNNTGYRNTEYTYSEARYAKRGQTVEGYIQNQERVQRLTGVKRTHQEDGSGEQVEQFSQQRQRTNYYPPQGSYQYQQYQQQTQYGSYQKPPQTQMPNYNLHQYRNYQPSDQQQQYGQYQQQQQPNQNQSSQYQKQQPQPAGQQQTQYQVQDLLNQFSQQERNQPNSAQNSSYQQNQRPNNRFSALQDDQDNQQDNRQRQNPQQQQQPRADPNNPLNSLLGNQQQQQQQQQYQNKRR